MNLAFALSKAGHCLRGDAVCKLPVMARTYLLGVELCTIRALTVLVDDEDVWRRARFEPRPDYGVSVQVPIMALTATATPRVQTEIMSNLRLRNPLVCRTSFNRWNLHYSVSGEG